MASTIERGIRETDVWKAADALLLEGARPTIERIRQKVGRGSPNTVGPYLDTWFKGLGTRIRDPGAFAAAPVHPDSITQAATHFWETALSLAREEAERLFQDERQALAVASDALAAQQSALGLEKAALLSRAEAQVEAMQLLRDQLGEAREQRDALQRMLDDRNAACAGVEARLTAAASDFDALRREFDQERSRLEAERCAIEERAAAHEKRWLQELDRARVAVKSTEASAQQARKNHALQLAELQRDLQKTTDERSQLVDRAAVLESELRSLRDKITAATADAKRLQAQLHQLELANDRKSDLLQTQLTAVLAKLDKRDGEIEILIRKMTEGPVKRGKMLKALGRANDS